MDNHARLHEHINKFMAQQTDINKSTLRSLEKLIDNQRKLTEIADILATIKRIEEIPLEKLKQEKRDGDVETDILNEERR